MPNVAPRGLHARSGSTWKVPVNVWARVAGAWKQADYVWAYRDGAWQLIWGRVPAPPATATATWVAPATVRIDWTAPAVNTNTQWIVKRSDNTVVGTVPVGTLTITDTRPLLATVTTSDSTTGAYTVEGSDGSTSSTPLATNTVTFNLTAATQNVAVSYPSASTANVTISWTPNATYGAPQGWRIWDGGWVSDVLPSGATTLTLTNQPRGVLKNYRVVPFTQTAAGAWVQAGNAADVPAALQAIIPPSMTLTATTSPISNLRGAWGAPGGSRTGFEVQVYVSSWVAYTTTAALSIDWGTTATGYMRVRTLSAGGPSDWIQAGPTAPINDTTGPGPSYIASWQPEASYGRMVVRGNWSSDGDTATGAIYYHTAATGWVLVWGRSAVSPGGAIALAVGSFSAGQAVTVLVRTWDAIGNVGSDATASYTLLASPTIIDPSGDGSGTWRESYWRNDATRSYNEIATGWTSSGHNQGCFFYNNQVQIVLGFKTVVSATIQYWREDEGGIGAAVEPVFWTHVAWDRSQVPHRSDCGVEEYWRTGVGVARTGSNYAVWTMPLQFAWALQLGNAFGIAMYRGYRGSGDPDNYYALLGIGGQVGPGFYVNGRLIFQHLG